MAAPSRPTDKTRRRTSARLPLPSTSHHLHTIPLSDVLPTPVNAPFVAFAQEVSDDNRRVLSIPLPVAPSSPVKRIREAALDEHEHEQDSQRQRLAADTERYQMELNDDDEFEEEPVSDPTKPADPAMSQWLMLHRDTYLRAFLWRDGRGDAPLLCPGCSDATRPAVVRCRDCYGGTLWCESCCAAVHQHNPLHCVEKWTGAYFARYSLRECGLRIQLGHNGHRCPDSRRGRDGFVVLDTRGVHEVHVDFCGCYHSRDPDFLQLLRVGWYPSTTTSPQTCATFACLDLFHSLSLHGKTSAYDFYAALETLTNGAGVKPPDRYKVFLRIVRQYRHLLLLKRAGRGHDRYGVLGTAQGELARRCPVCPRPGVNLPEGWQSASPEEQFLYTMTIALDACFRLKRRLISSWAKDPVLGPGWAFMVDPVPYLKYLEGVTEQDDMSTCSGLAAVEQANTKFSRGYAATGVGMGVCARHEFILPTSVADLQRGERYSNMDWVFFSLLQHISHLLWLIVSYDIVCQWTKKLQERVKSLAPHLRINVIFALLRFVIPKLHILGHVLRCRLLFSLLLLRGGAQTDGEGIERPWSMIGAVAASTRASGPGSRSDQLDDHWSFWNWRKVLGLPVLLRRRLDKARVELEKQEDSFAVFSKEQASMVPRWMEMVNEWEQDNSRPNPYEATVEGLSERAVREQFEQEESAQQALGSRRIHDVGPTEFIVSLLAVEDEQRRVRSMAELKRANSTALKLNLRRARRRLNKNISRIRSLQTTYMPAAILHLEALSLPQDTLAEKVPLLPPSALTATERSDGGCRDGLLKIEREMREAQCRSALASLRNQLHVKFRLLIGKKLHSRHQKANTRSRALIARNENKILLHSDKYQSARRALVAIAGDATTVTWPLLLKEDIRCMDDSDDGWQVPDDEVVFGGDSTAPRRQGESRRVVSWIWRLTGRGGTDAEIQESLRVEWCKAYARTRRWREEVWLLEEEWRRLPLSLAHEERLWDQRGASGQSLGATDAEKEGLVAYAAKQADMFRDLARRAEVVRTAPKLRRGCKRGAGKLSGYIAMARLAGRVTKLRMKLLMCMWT
ncbi:CxC2 domain-containing protein [Mycena kentingensis (nom. inval.)]|nr:CxC2 domain-containing protein [Mycena kentingensis (nom. inval.)]